MDETKNPIEQFAQIYHDKQALESRIHSASEFIRDVLKTGVQQAELKLQELAQDEAVTTFYAGLDEQLRSAAAELDAVKPILENLGMQTEIAAKEAEIDVMRADPKLKVAQYLGSITGVKLELIPQAEAAQLDIEPPTKPTPTPVLTPKLVNPSVETPAAETAESGEKDRKKVTILVDPRFNISVNGRSVAIGREMRIVSSKFTEQQIREFRVKALKLIASEPERVFIVPEIAAELFPELAGTRKGYLQTVHYVVDFLRDSPMSSRRPLIESEKVRQKLYRYRAGNFDFEFGATDAVLNPREEKVFTAASGAEIGGRAGELLLMLSKATAANPVTNERVLKLYTPSELASIKLKPSSVLSSLVSGVRDFARANGLQIARVNLEQRSKANRATGGYYLETLDGDNASAPHHQPVELTPDTVVELNQTAEATAQEAETFLLDKTWPLKHAAVFTAFLSQHVDVLEECGIKPLPREIHEVVMLQAFNGDSANDVVLNEELNELRELAIEQMQGFLKDPSIIEKILDNLTDDDARFGLAAYIEGLSEQDWAVMEELLLQSKELVITFDLRRRGGLEIVDVKKRYIGSTAIEDLVKTATPVVVPTSELTKEQRLQLKTMEIATEVIDLMKKYNLTNGSTPLNQILKTLRIRKNPVTKLKELHFITHAGRTSRQSPFEPQDILKIGVAERMKQEIIDVHNREIIKLAVHEFWRQFTEKQTATN